MDSIVFLVVLLVILLIGLPIAVIVLFVTTRDRHRQLQRQIDRLREQLAEIRQTAAAGPAPVDATPQAVAEAEPAASALAEAPAEAPAPAREDQAAPTEAAAAASGPPPAPRFEPETIPTPHGKGPVDHFEEFLRRGGDAVLRYFTDGNLFVRIGLLVLFCGVAFLLKYAADSGFFPREARYMGAAIGGIGLMLFGWRLRHSRAAYSLLLQGGGVGITYITIFAAFRIADLIPSALTFALLVTFAAVTVALAILQNSRALAIYALVGGFVAPFLASSGSGNYIGLFGYYAVLNAAVFGVAWFRAWRALNLLGFAFTFGVLAVWMAFGYRDADLYPTLGFVGLFFLMYSLIGVLYALRQPQNLTGLVDGTLVFGTPVIVSGLLMAMLRDYEFGIAGATAGLGLYYLILARYAWRHVGEAFRLLAEAMLAIGVVFMTLAIPYALDGHWSSAAWALEAAGILWVSIRQKRFYAQCFAIALQVGSGCLFLLRNAGDVGETAWLNPAFLGGVFIALGAFVSARMLYLQAGDFRLRPAQLPFFLWGMAWWLGSFLLQIDTYIDHQMSAVLVLFAATAALLAWLDRVRGWDWSPASVSAALLLPVLALLGLLSLMQQDHVLVLPDLWFWIPALAINYWIIEKLEQLDWPDSVRLGLHIAFVFFVAMLLSFELYWLIDTRLAAYGDGYRAIIALVPMLAVHAAQKQWFPAIKRLGRELQLGIIATLTLALILWSLVTNFTNGGNPAPLPYLPLLNPVDLAHLFFFMLLLSSHRLIDANRGDLRDQVTIILGALVFVWITALLIRSLHHYLGIAFEARVILPDTSVQTAISILWTLIGIGAMWFASRRSLRTLWITAAGLVGVVLVKMFFVDLGASGTVERIVSFLVVGSLLVATGYFSPIPPKTDEQQDVPTEASHA